MSSESSAKSPRRRGIIAGLLSLLAAGGASWFASRSKRQAGLTVVQADKTAALPVKVEQAALVDAAPAQPMSREWFLPHLNSEFSIQSETLSATPVKLVEVSSAAELRDKDHGVSYTSFSLLFKGSKTAEARAQIFSIRHAELPRMEVFLTPVGYDKGSTAYEAVFSHRI